MAKNATALFEIRTRVTEALALGGGNGNAGVDVDTAKQFANGTGVGAGNDWWGAVAAVTAGAPVTKTLSALVDDAGRSCPFAKIRGIAIYNLGGGDLAIGGAATHAWTGFLGTATDTLKIPLNGAFCLIAPEAPGLPVTIGANDQLQIAAVSGTVNYQIVLYGED